MVENVVIFYSYAVYMHVHACAWVSSEGSNATIKLFNLPTVNPSSQGGGHLNVCTYVVSRLRLC